MKKKIKYKTANLPEADYDLISNFCKQKGFVISIFLSDAGKAAIELRKKEENLKKMI